MVRGFPPAAEARWLLFENILLVLLKPVLPADLPPASLWPRLWALGAMTVISLLVGLRPYRLLLATQLLRCAAMLSLASGR